MLGNTFIFQFRDNNDNLTGTITYKQNQCTFKSHEPGTQDWSTTTSYQECIERAVTIKESRWCNADYTGLISSIYVLITTVNVMVLIMKVLNKVFSYEEGKKAK